MSPTPTPTLRDPQDAPAPGFDGEPREPDAEGEIRMGEEGAWIRSLVVVLGVAVLGLLVYAAFQPGEGSFATVFTVALLLATSCLLIGGLVGFLFGIPRSLQQGEAEAEEGAAEGGRDRRRSGYRANTNLEQISDWLTKILVGVGLTQLGEVRSTLDSLAGFFGPPLGGAPAGGPFAVVVAVTFLTCGFLVGYLWSRLYLATAFSRADRQARTALRSVTHVVSQMQERMSDQEEQARVDAEALSLVQRWLEPEWGEPAVSREEVEEHLRRASPSVKVHSFYQAQKLRTDTWRDDKERMERTVPIFEALAESNEDRFHRDFAQLGYALKDQPEPDYRAALEALDRAIDIRGTWKENGWLMYELNRAICRIQLDEDFRRGRPSSPETAELILSDLEAAAHSSFVRDAMEDSPAKEWMEINEVRMEDLPPAGPEG